jgi:hypothetical protein
MFSILPGAFFRNTTIVFIPAVHNSVASCVQTTCMYLSYYIVQERIRVYRFEWFQNQSLQFFFISLGGTQLKLSFFNMS